MSKQNIYPGEPLFDTEFILNDSTPDKLRKRDEMLKKANVYEAIDALFATMFSVAYAEINRIEEHHPWFDEPENKGMLDFDFFYTLVSKSIAHIMKDKSQVDKCAIADLIMNDVADCIGMPLPTSPATPENLQRINDFITKSVEESGISGQVNEGH